MSAWESFKREATAARVERARKVMNDSWCSYLLQSHTNSPSHLCYPPSLSPRISRIAWYLLSTVALWLLMVMSLPLLCWASSAANIRRWCSQWCTPLWEIRYWKNRWMGTTSNNLLCIKYTLTYLTSKGFFVSSSPRKLSIEICIMRININDSRRR